VWGFTHDDPNVQPHNRGLFDGVSERIENGYFEQLGANALSLMPINEFSGMQGANTLGYNTSVFPAIERDFGLPDDLRRMVNVAHRNGLAVAADMVFNHADNSFNPLWNLILEHPDEAAQKGNGGLFFSGETPWGNRVATERVEVQNFLIDVCKLMLHEYHLDGFRFDFTHSSLMSHEFLHRLADELQAFHPQVLLIAENLPNERNLNREGFNGFAQWSNAFHDKLKAMLRQADFEGQLPDFAGIGDIFYFSKSGFAAHTNNVVNYVESHDENSVSFEVATNPSLNLPDTKERKSRLGLFASIVALGTPMIYMGQEYQLERERNLVACPWPENPDDSHFFNWSSALLKLRRRYPALHLHGFDPIADGQFAWILGGFLPDPRRGGGCKLVGWRAQPNGKAHEAMVVLLNFEANDVTVDVDFGIPGVWVQLATLDYVHDVPPYSDNGPQDEKAIRTEGVFANFVLPSSSGLIYKWVADLDA
jgi:1,4-alpha-glucan branching enzyme